MLGIDQWNQPMQYQSLYAIEIAMAIKSKVEMPEIAIKSSNLLVYISNTSSHRTSYLDSPHPFNAHIITNCAISFNWIFFSFLSTELGIELMIIPNDWDINAFRFYCCCYLFFHPDYLQSRLIPTAKHFLKRQYWHRFRFKRMTKHLPSRKHRYSICFWMLRRKKPCTNKIYQC